MKNKKTVMVLALVIVSSVLMTASLVQASGNKLAISTKANTKALKENSQALTASPQALMHKVPTQTLRRTTAQISNVAKPVKLTQASHAVQSIDDIQLEEVNDEIATEIDTLVQAYEDLPEEEKKTPVRGVWVVVARGFSWGSSSIPETSDVASESIPMAMRFYAKAIWGNQEWTLYKLRRGIIGHDGERYHVDGYALYKKETGKFYIVLDGDGVSLQAVGKVYGPNADITAANCRRCLRLAMKGRMSIDGDGYAFCLRGYAYRLPILRAKPVEEAEIQSSN